jgi:hypothetical protein
MSPPLCDRCVRTHKGSVPLLRATRSSFQFALVQDHCLSCESRFFHPQNDRLELFIQIGGAFRISDLKIARNAVMSCEGLNRLVQLCAVLGSLRYLRSERKNHLVGFRVDLAFREPVSNSAKPRSRICVRRDGQGVLRQGCTQ